MNLFDLRILNTKKLVNIESSRDHFFSLYKEGYVTRTKMQNRDIFNCDIVWNEYTYDTFFIFKEGKFSINLIWKDGPLTKVVWEEVSLNLLNKEYLILRKSYERYFETVPNIKKNEIMWSICGNHKLTLAKNIRDYSVITFIE